LAVALMGLGFFLGGCPDEGVVCGEGLTRCGLDCVDTTSESDNCGACGVACGQSQVCAESTCQCREGSTECGGQCVVLSSDARNCGACGVTCGQSQVCEAGTCKTSCALGLSVCGGACVDPQSNPNHCGACGNACGPSQVCEAGACRSACSPGLSRCGDACVNLQSNAANCGACGNPCGASQVCEAGACKTQCSAGQTQCGTSCVDLQTNPENCGACGTVCTDARACRAGVCQHDVVAACFNTGQVVGIQGGQNSAIKGPNAPVGDRPQSVGRMQDVLLVLDAAPALRQARLFDYGALPDTDLVGNAPNQVLVSDPYVYVLNSTDNTLVTYLRTATPDAITGGTRFPGGLGLVPVEGGSVNFGPNTNPFAMVKVGAELFVSLYGNLGGDVSAGGKVARVSLADPAHPALTQPVLQLPTGAALLPFQGASPIPSPAGISAVNGSVYVTLNNLDPTTFGPGGPGLLAKVNPTSFTVEKLINLGEGCLNPGWAAPSGNQLVVSCSGKSTYDASFNLVAVEKSGLVLVGADDAVLATAPLACPPGSTGCALPSAGRFATVGSRVYLGDQNAGRVFVYEVANNGLREVRGLGVGSPILACPRASGPSLVGDVVAVE
jgi:hypothetical protein